MIFREMRQKKQELSRQEIADILHKGTSGVLALLGDNDYPYAVPISYVYDDGKIYFHSAKSGHKIDAIQRTAKASFCVIDKDLVIPEGMRLDVDENAIVATIADNSAVDTDEDQSEDGTESKQ